MRKLLLLLLLSLIPVVLLAQAPSVTPLSRFDGFVAPAGAPNAPALVAVCAAGTGGGPPCSPLVVIYTDASGTQQQANPFSSSASGRYTFFVPAGTYAVQTYGTGYTTSISTFTLASATPASASGGPASTQLNPKNFGAFGDTQSVTGGFTQAGATYTCASCNFTTGDIGKTAYRGSNTNGLMDFGVIASVSGSTITLSGFTTVAGGAPAILVWGHIDDPAFNALSVPLSTALAKTANVSQGFQNLGVLSQSTTVYIPTGGYMLCGVSGASATAPLHITVAVNFFGLTIRGDGPFQSVIYPCPSNQTATPPFNSGWLFTDSTGGSSSATTMSGFSIEGAYLNFPNRFLFGLGLGNHSSDVSCAHFGSTSAVVVPCMVAAAGSYNENIVGAQNIQALNVNVNQVDFVGSVLSNNTINLTVSGVLGGQLGGGGGGFRWNGGLLDECASTVACEQITNSTDVYFSNTAMFSATGAAGAKAVSVDSTSQVHMTDVVCGQFSGGGCGSVSAGGLLILNDVRAFHGAAGQCYSNSGIIVSLGQTTCYNNIAMAATNSATESGNTVTLTTNGTAHNWNPGDFIACGGSMNSNINFSVTAYDGVWQVLTTPTTTTATFRHPTAGLAAANGGNCAGAIAGTTAGNPTFGAITHSQWNSTIPTLTATSTTANTPAFWTPDQPVKINRFSVGVSPAPAGCVTNAVLQLTNGTFTQNLTITGAQQDTGLLDQLVGFTSPAGKQISVIVLTAAATCGTTPANAQINMLWQANMEP